MKVSPFNSCQDCEYRGLRMFCNLSPEALDEFSTLGSQMMLPRGTVLFREDDPARNVTVVCHGQLKLSCTSADGKTLILKIGVGGDVLGLSAVLTGAVHEATAETLDACLVRTIGKDQFSGFLEKYGQARMHAAKSLSEDYRAAFYDARRLALSSSVKARVASVLLEWGRGACCGKNEIRFTMALTHEELGSLAGTSRESVSRILSSLQDEKLIQVRGSSIYIPRPDQLEAASR